MTAPLVSRRLTLRLPALEDVPTFVAHLNDPGVSEHLSHVPYPYTEQDGIDFVRSKTGDGPLDIGEVYVIEESETGKMIGTIGVRRLDLPGGGAVGEIGYWLAREAWGRGFASEAVAALIPVCWASGIERLTAHVNVENAASRRVLAKNGFAEVGMAELWMPARNRSNTSVLMALEPGRHPTDSSVPILTVVAVALLDGDDRVLVAQRPPGKPMAGLWEFPGGKLHAGESPEEALIRELREELAVDTEQSCLAPFSFASHRYEAFHLLMPLYVCRVWQGRPTAQEGQVLRWVPVQALGGLAMPPADVPLVAMLRDYL